MRSDLYYFLLNKGLIIARSGGSLPNAALNEAEVSEIEKQFLDYKFLWE